MRNESTSSGGNASTTTAGIPAFDGKVEQVTVTHSGSSDRGDAYGRPSEHGKTVDRADQRSTGKKD